METVVGVEGSDEGKGENSGVEKCSSTFSSPKQFADPVVYKLVRVEGDGRLVPATDDEVMEVEEFLVDDKIAIQVTDTEKTVECISRSEGLSHAGNRDSGMEKPTLLEEQDTVRSSAPSLNDSHVSLIGSTGECSKPPYEPAESMPSASGDWTSSKPEFSKLKEDICLDNLSIRELHELFRSTFGRETTVKDKLWLKRRIAMGLTNSCDVASTTFVIRNNKLIKNDKLVEKGKESFDDEGTILAMGSEVKTYNLSCKSSPVSNSGQIENHQTDSCQRSRNSSIDFDYQSEDPHTEQRATKRIRKPTRRYIEELSESESKDYTPKVFNSAQDSGLGETHAKSYLRPVRSVCSNERTMVMRLDSLGGSGFQIPFVSRARRSRPRKNITGLLKFHSTNEGITADGGKKVVAAPSFPPDNELPAEQEKDKRSSVVGAIQLGKSLGPKLAESSEDTSDDNIATVPTTKGGMRRKHHRAWTLVEVMKLVEGVSKCGAGRWSEIKRLAFASYSYRTSVDLKDKWRNLLKASFAQTLPDDGINSRKNTSVSIPASILLRVRELAEMHSQVPPNLGSRKMTGVSGKSVHEMQSGYL